MSCTNDILFAEYTPLEFLQIDKNIIAFWPSPRPHTSLSITDELLIIEKFKVLITPPLELLSTLRDEKVNAIEDINPFELSVAVEISPPTTEQKESEDKNNLHFSYFLIK